MQSEKIGAGRSSCRPQPPWFRPCIPPPNSRPPSPPPTALTRTLTRWGQNRPFGRLQGNPSRGVPGAKQANTTSLLRAACADCKKNGADNGVLACQPKLGESLVRRRLEHSAMADNPESLRVWSGRWESNPPYRLGKPVHYHYATPASEGCVILAVSSSKSSQSW